MTAEQILEELERLGRASYKCVLVKNHGVKEPVFGVPISELKKFQKRLRINYQLALDLYATGNYDAMYLAGLIADDARMTRQDLERWVNHANAGPLCGATVPWVAAGSAHGREIALKWIDAPEPNVVSAGWATLSSLVAVTKDTDLDLTELTALLQRVERTLHHSADRVRYK